MTDRLDGVRVVVGAAVVRGSRLLAQRRGHPAELADRWELPGGRVEPGESEPEALRRECREELGVAVVAHRRLGVDVALRAGLVLRIWVAELADPAAEPRPVEHRELRWVAAGELAGLDWLDADRALLPDLVKLLTGRSPGATGTVVR